jgi:chemotaxis signal transduction protein
MNELTSPSSDVPKTGGLHTGHAPAVAVENTIPLAILRCAGATYGIDLKWVREIRPFAGAAPIHGFPPFWIGITASRGLLYAMLDLQQFLTSQPLSAENHRHVVYTVVNDLRIGLVVEALPAVSQFDVQSLTTPLTPTQTGFEPGETPDQIILLDLPTLFEDPRLTAAADQPNKTEA